MFFGSEMQHPAVWASYAAAVHAANIIRRSAPKYNVFATEAFDEEMNTIGWVVCIYDDLCATFATHGYIAALMSRHDVPAVFEDREIGGRAARSVDVANVPGWKDTPMYDELPKDGPACIHVKWG